jgi:hypothetical protein
MPKWHGRDKACSIACRNALISKNKQKYTAEQIDQVIALKKAFMTNLHIKEKTGVKLSKIKEIVKQHNLFVGREVSQKNAYSSKLSKDPDAMSKMREQYRKKVRSQTSLDRAIKIIESRGYEYVEGFTSISKPFWVKCKICKKDKETSKINTLIENSCLNCSGTGTSKQEKVIEEWINSLGLPAERFKFPKRKGGRELDIYVPSLKIGIEYCGLYWHNEDSPTPRARMYHKHKMDKADAHGIRLITIFEDEWRDRQSQVKNFVKSALNVHEKKIFARKCQIRTLKSPEAAAFLESNHIQGAGKILVAFGIFFDNDLIGVITGSSHHRKMNENELILNRLAFKDGWLVVGGASRLTSALLKYAKENGYTKLISWSDNRWSQGKVYKQLGFNLEAELGPEYSYVNGSNRESKQSCQKKNLVKRGGVGVTELEMANSLNLHRIWDCGKKRWTMDVS